jgi:hypothetical protein
VIDRKRLTQLSGRATAEQHPKEFPMAGQPAARDHSTLKGGRSRRDVIALAPSSVIAASVGALGFSREPAAAGKRSDSANPGDVSDGTALTASRKAYYRRARF